MRMIVGTALELKVDQTKITPREVRILQCMLVEALAKNEGEPEKAMYLRKWDGTTTDEIVFWSRDQTGRFLFMDGHGVEHDPIGKLVEVVDDGETVLSVQFRRSIQ